jgi:MSHA pilin protein MshC
VLAAAGYLVRAVAACDVVTAFSIFKLLQGGVMKSVVQKTAGFTLVELVTILVIVGILAVFATPRFVDRTGFESRGFYDQAQSTVRYAQKIAISQRQSPPKPAVFVVIAANGIRVCYDAACATPVVDPTTGAAMAVNAPNGIALTPATFSYDGSGAPSIAAQLAIGVTSAGVGDINRTFFVEAQTGYVHP